MEFLIKAQRAGFKFAEIPSAEKARTAGKSKVKDGAPIDRTMDDTYQRVARTLADVERPNARDQWRERFLWALRKGAIPAGRITSNAGALEHKPEEINIGPVRVNAG